MPSDEGAPVDLQFETHVETSITVTNFTERYHACVNGALRWNEQVFRSKSIPCASVNPENPENPDYLGRIKGLGRIRASVLLRDRWFYCLTESYLKQQGDIRVNVENCDQTDGYDTCHSLQMVRVQISCGDVCLTETATDLKGSLFISNIFGTKNPEHYVDEEDNLTITLRVTVVSRTYNGARKDVCLPEDRNMGASASFLANDIMSYLKEGADSSDVNLVCNDVRYPVHKTILAARSDVFARMFQHNNCKEATTKEVNIMDVDTPTLNKFIKFIYGGDINCNSCNSFSDVDPLYLMAEKYNVQGLIGICREILIKQMSSKYFVRAAILGYLTNDEALKSAAMTAMGETGKGIKDMEDWKELKKYPDLAFDIMHHCMSSDSPSSKRRKTE